MEFNTREIATLIWFAIAAAYALYKDKDGSIRKSVGNLITAFFNRHILGSILFAEIWIILTVKVLAALGIWDSGNLKTTIMWAISFGFLTLLDINRVTQDDTFFSKTVRDIVSVTAIILFIAESYTFPLLAELVMIPVLAFLTALQVFSERDKKHTQVRSLIANILAIVGLTYFGFGLAYVINSWGTFATPDTVIDFSLPILLSLAFLPFIYLLSTYVAYELIWLSVHHAIKDPALARFAFWRAALAFQFDLDGIRRWRRNTFASRPHSRGDVRRQIKEVKTLQAKERQPPPVAPEAGWSPYEAVKFLEREGLRPDDYHRYYDDEWGAGSNYLNVGDEKILSDNIAYYVDGDEHAAKRLKVVLNVNNPAQSETSDLRFFKVCEALLSAIGIEFEPDTRVRFRTSDELDVHAGNRKLYLSREDFQNVESGYSRSFTVNHCSDYNHPWEKN